MASLAAAIERVAAHAAPSIVSASSIAAIEGLCDRLPAELSDCLFLERWLTEEHRNADLILRVRPSAAGVLAAIDPRTTIASDLRARPEWRALERFAREWLPAEAPLARGIEGLWLEFDRASGAALSRTPRVFFDFRREVYASADRGAQLLLALEAIRALGAEPSSALADSLEDCLSRLPPGACVPYIGVSLDSPVHAVRLCVLGAQTADLAPYLVSIGWPGDGDELSKGILAEFAHTGGDTHKSVSLLHLEAGLEVGPRVGLEYRLERRSQLQGQVREHALLDLLVARGWCASTARDALLRWPGISVELMEHEIWYRRFVRRLNHIKLTYASGQPVHVKAYLCCSHALLRGAALAADLLGYPRRYPRELLPLDVLGRGAVPARACARPGSR
jgi:hypothetical protein